jgi:hypothetical protein
MGQLEVVNAMLLRTICNFDSLPPSQGLIAAGATLIYPEALIKLD